MSDKERYLIFHEIDIFLSSSNKYINDNNQFHSTKSIEVHSSPLHIVIDEKKYFQNRYIKAWCSGSGIRCSAKHSANFKKNKTINC